MITADRLRDDLVGTLRGDVDCDPVTTMLYASDASIYQIQPLGVVRPRGAADVAAVVSYAAANGLRIHPRGGGSGIAGESLGDGLVLDLSRYFRRITPARDGSTAAADAGATLWELNRALRRHGRWFGPDPITRSITTIGSVIARDACGSHYLRSGSARDNIRSLRFVAADGQIIQAGRHSTIESGPAGDLVRGLVAIVKKYERTLRREHSGSNLSSPSQPGVDSSGQWSSQSIGESGGRRTPWLNHPPPFYRVDDLIAGDGTVDLARFMCGTQGTLGVITDAVVDGENIPTHRAVAVFFYHRLDSAVRAAAASIDMGTVAADWMDRRLLQIARQTDSRYRAWIPSAAEAMVLCELQGESESDLRHRLSVLESVMSRGDDAAFGYVDAVDRHDRDHLWSLPRRVIPRLYQLRADAAPQPFIEDVRVPPTRLVDAIAAVRDVLSSVGTTATMFGQTGRGSLHIRPFLNLALPDDRKRLLELSRGIAEVVWDHGGHISVGHAAGLSKSHLLPAQYGPWWRVMGEVRRLFDPTEMFNPGRLFGSSLPEPNERLRPSHRQIEIVNGDRVVEEADRHSAAMRRAGRREISSLPVLQHWPPGGELSAAARLCNGCGRCRSLGDDSRQCPVFRATPTEEATPRAKANLLRAIVSGQLPVEALSSEAAKRVADLCFNCHQCRLDCPASVDVPKIVGEIKAQHVADNGQTFAEVFLSRIDSVAAAASRFPWISNRLMRSPMARFLAERLIGFSAARELPTVSRETFLRQATRRRWHRPVDYGGLKVCYFVDHYANHHDPDIGRAVAEVIQHNSIGLYVPAGQIPSGMARITSGDLASARKVARRNVRVLIEAVRAGYDIVASEPAAVLCLKHEYPNLLGTEDAHKVADRTRDIFDYLWYIHGGRRLDTRFESIDASIAYHLPCHLRVLDPTYTTAKVLDLIPSLDVQIIEAGCSGMAGTWGLRRENYRNSLRIGWPLISKMRAADVTAAASDCSACRMQIHHGSGRASVHPIKLLAAAYGRMPIEDVIHINQNPTTEN